jgi:hypothetical protein
MPDDADPLPRGPVLSGLDSPIRTACLTVFLLTTLSLLWPVYPAVSGIRPYVLGLPFSFAWIVGWLVVMFGALVVLYRHDSVSDD